MFADELGGSAARKRQEQARARRRQLKEQQQQQKKKGEVVSAAPQSSNSSDATSKTTGGNDGRASTAHSPLAASEGAYRPVTSSAGPGVTKPSPKEAFTNPVPTSSSQPSAVALALQQRKIRNQQKLQVSSAVAIQSHFRAYRSNVLLKRSEGALFDKRMSDLVTLTNILKQAGKGDYAPPPATASAIVTQVLFLASRTPFWRKGGQDSLETKYSKTGGMVGPAIGAKCTFILNTDTATRISSLIDYVLLPGLLSDDDNLDPIMPWTQIRGGRMRLDKLLCLLLACMAAPHSITTDEVAAAIDRFLRAALGVPRKTVGSATEKAARSVIVQYCTRKVIFSDIIDGSLCESSLNLLQVTRTLLLYNTGSSPIPHDAEKLREKCILPKDRARADMVFSLVMDTVLGSADVKLQSRFVADMLTIPLLTWKLSPLLISKVTAGVMGTSPPLLVLLRGFVEHNSAALSKGQLVSLLPSQDVSLTTCPAPSVLCLLANLVQLGHFCTTINGSDITELDFDDAAMYFNLLSTVIDLVPLGAFSSRQSAVEWVSLGGAHHTPIVLSNVIIDQCKTLVLDSYVRQLFTCAIDNIALDTDGIIETKNDKDLKHEKEMLDVGATSATSLAAKEAMVDRSKSFWLSSKWARKLSQSVTSLLSGDSSKSAKSSSVGPKGGGMLLNTSSIARHLANGGGRDNNATAAVLASQECSAEETTTSASARVAKAYTTSFLFSLCRAYGSILARWGGGGKDDIVRRTIQTKKDSAKIDPENTSGEATGQPDPCVLSLLNVICFATGIVKTTWAIIQSDRQIVSDLYSVIDSEKRAAPIRTLRIRPTYDRASVSKHGVRDGATGAALLFIFVTCLAHVLIVTDDVEIYEMEKPLPQHQLRRCILLLKKLLYRACCTDDIQTREDSSNLWESNYFGLALISGASKTMRDLYDRSSRRPLCVPKLWLVEDLLERDIRRCKSHQDYASLLSAPVLRVCPFLVSFKRRLKIFERIVTTDRIEIQGSNDQQNLKPGVVVRIMRGRVLEDGLMTLNNLGRNMRQRIVVQYLNQAGATETGVDVGGLFKEFWTDLSNLAFDPNYALFLATEGSGNCLYPSPSSRAAHGSDHIVLFEFLGRILGKALYEGITIQPQFAHFFLSFLRGDYNFLHMLPDLSTMDPQLYNNLMFLKTYEGDATDLCLTFTVANDDFGGNEEVPLIPNGANIEVTNANKQRYIGLVAKHHVCDRVREQSEAFTRGLWEVIDRSWLRTFNEPELQVLISGASDGKIDVSDMKANTRYTGGYTGLDKHVYRFWNVVSSINSKQQADLLRFVTSCERPPPLGFASMNPPFTIQRVGIMRDGDKLPTASTCFNTLKLPTYSSEKVLRERLLFAIQAGAGFELT